MEELVETIMSCFRYDSNTGRAVWKVRPVSHFKTKRAASIWNAKYPNKNFGCETRVVSGAIYIEGSLNNKKIKEHRVVWILHNGDIPAGMEIDHINHVKTDNRIENLRLTTGHENRKNTPIPKTNTSGIMGVGWCAGPRKWRATIMVNGKHVHLGYFKNKDEAAAARIAGQEKYGFHKNHGLPPAGLRVKEK